jgi:hypothetical protein
MKYLKKFYLLENKEAIQNLLDNSEVKIDPSDIEYFKKVTKKTPNNLFKLLKWITQGEEPSDISTVYEYYIELRNRNLKVPDINKFKKPEDLYDALQNLEIEFNINKIIQELPSHLKRQYKKLSEDDKIDYEYSFYELSKKDNKNDLIKKISRYKTLPELMKVIDNFVKGSDDYRSILLSLESDPGAEVIYNERNIIVAKINDYSCSAKHGSPSWCISTSINFFHNYTDNNEQFFIWNFNLDIKDKLHMIGVTRYDLDEIILNNINQIKTAHDKNDNYINSEKLANILKDMGIYDIIFIDIDNLNDKRIMKLLKESNYISAIMFILKYTKYAIPYLKYFMKNNNDSKRDIIVRLHLYKSGINFDYYSDDKLQEVIDKKTTGELIDLLRILSSDYIIRGLLNKFLENKIVSSKKVSLDLENLNLSERYLDSKVIMLILKNTKKIVDTREEEFAFYIKNKDYINDRDNRELFYRYGLTKVNKYFKELAKYHEEFKDIELKFQAATLCGDDIKASEYLKEFDMDMVKKNESKIFYLFRRTMKVKDGRDIKNKNILDFYEKTNQKYFVDHFIQIYNFLDFSKKDLIKMLNKTHYHFTKIQLIKKLIDMDSYNSYKNTFKDNEYAEMGLSILKNNKDVAYIRDYAPFIEKATPKQIDKYKELINGMLSDIKKKNVSLIKISLLTGDDDVINNYFDEIKKHIESCINHNYHTDFSEVFIATYRSKKMDITMFKKIMSFIIETVENKSTYPETYFYSMIRDVFFIQGDISKVEYILKRCKNHITKKVITVLYSTVSDSYTNNNEERKMYEKIKKYLERNLPEFI